MQFKINCSPHLMMNEITKMLFNRNFLSDIRFSVGNKIIFAHSLELMKRSVVFQHQFEDTLGEKKIISISDCSYESFLEFVRFIYTDDCEINSNNGIELLKLATKYKIVMLENRVINLLHSINWNLQLFEYCVVENYEIARNLSNILFAVNFGRLLNTKKYSSLQQDALNEALQLDQIEEGVKEVQIFDSLAGWIDKYCKQHNMSLTQGRERFDHLIRKIRFPTMTNDEIRECVKKYPGLLHDSDCMSIATQVLFGSDGEHNLWVSKRRTDFKPQRAWRKTNRGTPFLTTFFVSKNTILQGLLIGVEQERKPIEINITEKNIKTFNCENIVFTQSAPKRWIRLLISLGDSLHLKPNFEYTITVKYLNLVDEHINVISRVENTDVILNDPENSVRAMNASDNVLEMIFNSPQKIDNLYN